MIFDSTPQDIVESFGDIETTTFSIETSGKAFVVLSSSLYKDKLRSIIRELSCNARDSHVEAGNLNPFDVHLPTSLEPEFWIRDYGTGLSADGIKTVFTIYFKSTKEKSNSSVGCLGLGSKSPFAYTSNFMVTSWHSGKQYIYSVFINDLSEPSISKMSECASDAPNGLEIRFSVTSDDFSKVYVAASQVYRWFDYIKPNFIGHQLQLPQIPKVAGFYFYTSRGGYQTAIKMSILMGGVEYPLDLSNPNVKEIDSVKEIMKIQPKNYQETTITVEVPIGSIDFTPSREELQYTRKTLSAIESLFTAALEEVIKEAPPLKEQDFNGLNFIECVRKMDAQMKMIKNLSDKMGVPEKIFQSRDSIINLIGKVFEKEIKGLVSLGLNISDPTSSSRVLSSTKIGTLIVNTSLIELPIVCLINDVTKFDSTLLRSAIGTEFHQINIFEESKNGYTKIVSDAKATKEAFESLGFSVKVASELFAENLKHRKYSTAYKARFELGTRDWDSLKISMISMKPSSYVELIDDIGPLKNVYHVPMKNKAIDPSDMNTDLYSILELALFVKFPFDLVGVYQPTRVDLSQVKSFDTDFVKDLDQWMASSFCRNPFIYHRMEKLLGEIDKVPNKSLKYLMETCGSVDIPIEQIVKYQESRKSGPTYINPHSDSRRSRVFESARIRKALFPISAYKDAHQFQINAETLITTNKIFEIMRGIIDKCQSEKNLITPSRYRSEIDPNPDSKEFFDNIVKNLYNLIKTT